jgi:hypothetical protein
MINKKGLKKSLFECFYPNGHQKCAGKCKMDELAFEGLEEADIQPAVHLEDGAVGFAEEHRGISVDI